MNYSELLTNIRNYSEVSSDVLEGSQSVVFDEAENRLHAQKAIMHFCIK